MTQHDRNPDALLAVVLDADPSLVADAATLSVLRDAFAEAEAEVAAQERRAAFYAVRRDDDEMTK